MIAPPAAAKTQIPISECAGKRDLPDIGKRQAEAGRRRRLDKRERARDLAGLVVQPFPFVFFRRPPAAFIDRQNRCVENTVAEGLQAQRPEALAIARNDLAAAGPVVEIFENYPGIR
jgi:hypothetical protein